MNYDIARRYEPQIEQVAQAKHITTDEALERIIQAGLERLVPIADQLPVSNAALFGSVKGPGAHGSKEAVDQYLAEMRAEW